MTVNPNGEPLTIDDIRSEVSNESTDKTRAALDRLKSLELLVQRNDGAYVVNFKWTQYPSDSSSERVRRHRKTRKSDNGSASPSLPEQRTAKQSKAEQNRTKGNVSADEASIGEDLANLPEIKF